MNTASDLEAGQKGEGNILKDEQQEGKRPVEPNHLVAAPVKKGSA
jgi:hypothetical protein